jgi:hypothetical protein
MRADAPPTNVQGWDSCIAWITAHASKQPRVDAACFMRFFERLGERTAALGSSTAAIRERVSSECPPERWG